MRAPRTGPARFIVAGALVLVLLLVALLVFSGGGGTDYQLVFKEAGQLVRGDQVQVGGVPVGSVTEIELTKDFKARVTIHVDSSLTPLHQGTVAEIRVPSLSSVANRYIALSLGPNNKPALATGSTLPANATKEVVDLDQLFNTLDPKTRKGLQGFLQGSAEQYVGQGPNIASSTEYFAPSLTATGHFLAEIARDQPVLTHFLVETAKAVTTIASRKDQLADLIENQNKTFKAVGSEHEALTRGLRQLPKTLRQGNRTFAELPSTFAALEKLLKTSRPTTKSLITLLEHLRPLVTAATTPTKNLRLAFSKPGASNDLTDLVRALPALAQRLSTASPNTVTALQESVPITAFFGPYSPDLVGTLRTFGQAGAYYDANGHYARATVDLPDFKLSENKLTPVASSQALEGLKAGQLRRCPGAATQPAADGSSPFTDNELLSCDPTQTP